MTAMQDNAAIVAHCARIAIKYCGFDLESAIDAAVSACKQEAEDARTRRGAFQYETTTEKLDAMRFLGSVADDVADNTPRPSTGPMRDYVRGLLA